LALAFVLAGWSAGAVAETLPPPPEGYLQVDRGLCKFVLPGRNASVTGELVPICDEELPRIFSQLGVDVLTLYTFSVENWQRPVTEVSALMKLDVEVCALYTLVPSQMAMMVCP